MLLHIGYPKTGTTTLQNHIFPHFGRFIGKDGDAEAEVRAAALDLLRCVPQRAELPEAEICSYEIMLRPGNMQELARRTAEAFPKVQKVFISIRRQDNLIWSQYLQDLGVANLRKFPDYRLYDALDLNMMPCTFPACIQDCSCGHIKKISLPFYEFEKIRSSYADYFEVLLLPLEFLSDNPTGYCEILSSFAEIPLPLIRDLPIKNKGPDVSKENNTSLLQELHEFYFSTNRDIDCPVDLSYYDYY